MKCVIIGAGKIARGFIGHLLYLSNIKFSFIEYSQELVDLINNRGCYTVNILGNSEKNCIVQGAKATCLVDFERAVEKVKDADCVFTAVGGKNLVSITGLLAKAIDAKADRSKQLIKAEGEDVIVSDVGSSMNIVTCENWKQPAMILRDEIESKIALSSKEYFDKCVGITEAVIMRSAIEADKEQLLSDPLIVNVQDFWELPIDASRVVGDMPKLQGLRMIDEFTGFLERKFYTYNAANGTTSYLGALLGYEKIADAAHDERILKVLDGVYQETAKALSRKHHFPLDEQLAFTLTSKRKLQDYTIVDYIERNARDPLRKLGKDDRLVGSARLVMEYGIVPDNLSIAIAAAIYYENDNDEFAVKLKKIRDEQGVDAVFENVCSLDPEGELALLVKEKIGFLKERGWINE